MLILSHLAKHKGIGFWLLSIDKNIEANQDLPLPK